MTQATAIADRFQSVEDRIAAACTAAGRSRATVGLIAVSKTRPAGDVRAAAALGQRDFGENYLQEALPKIAACADLDLTWHFLGPMQSNKTRAIAESFDWVHSLDRVKIAERLGAARPRSRGALRTFVQVNIDAEASKAGVRPEAAAELAATVAATSGLDFAGLMVIPAADGDPADAFARARRLLETLGVPATGLSMGMSGDLEAAVAAGATWLRIGTALFGPRAPRAAAPA